MNRRAFGRCSPLGALLLCASVAAEVVTDGTLGSATALPGPVYDVTADLGRQVGANLFHSFASFSVTGGETAVFSGPASVQNVVGRVTGGLGSRIDGALVSEIPGANLWLINPAGVVFGPDAQLYVDGSVSVSSAHYLGLADGARFVALDPGASRLSVAPPASFGFLDAPIGPIRVDNAALAVDAGERLSLVGGNLTIEQYGETPGGLQASGGRIDLVSLAGPGAVILTPDGPTISAQTPGGDVNLIARDRTGQGFDLLIDLDGDGGGALFLRGGRVFLDGALISSATSGAAAGAVVDVRVDSLRLVNGASISTLSSGSGPGSRIYIEAENDVQVIGSDRIGNPSSVSAGTWLDGQGGDIEIVAGELIIDGGLVDNQPAPELEDEDGHLVTGRGTSGDILIRVGALVLDHGGEISASTYGRGDGGAIRIQADESVWIGGRDAEGFASGVLADTWGAGRGGDIRIRTPVLVVDGAGIYAESLSGLEGQPQGGDAGSVRVEVDRLELLNGGLISTTTYSSGRGGDVQVQAHEQVSILNAAGTDANLGGIVADTEGHGRGGDVRIETGVLHIRFGEVRADSGIGSDAAGVLLGDAGNVEVKAERILLEDSAYISGTTFTAGNGGTITIEARDALVMRGSADAPAGGILANNHGSTGRGGDVRISAGRLELEYGLIGALSDVQGDAGSVSVHAGRAVLRDSAIASSTYEGGNGGSVEVIVDGGLDLHGEGSAIESLSLGRGQGGAVSVDAGRLNMTGGSEITSAGEFEGAAGSIRIRLAGELHMRGGSAILTRAATRGGDVEIDAGDLVYIHDGRISAAAEGASRGDSGGNLTLRARGFIVLNGAELLARAHGGDGGSIRLDSAYFVADAGSRLDASSELGVSGQVRVGAPETDLAGRLVLPLVALTDPGRLLDDPCLRRQFGEQASSLVVEPRRPRFRIENGRLIEAATPKPCVGAAP